MDDDSLFEAVQSSPFIETGAWNTLKYEDGTITKFRRDDFATVHMKDSKFRTRIMELVDQEVIQKFDKQTVSATQFYEDTMAVLPHTESDSD